MSNQLTFLLAWAMLILMKIVCFVLGYLTIRLGYKLIDSGAKGEFKFSGKLGGLKADLFSASPGLLFVLLGVFLIGYAIYVEKPLEMKEWREGREQIEKPPLPPTDAEPFPNEERKSP